MAVAVSVAVSFDINWGKGIGLGSCEKVYVATASPIESEWIHAFWQHNRAYVSYAQCVWGFSFAVAFAVGAGQ